MQFEEITFDANGLVPAVAQDARSGEVLMLAYMNRESLQKTLDSGLATYYSRSRKALWQKGETSGHVQRIVSIAYDCDGDTLLLKVEQEGPACHTGEHSCFFRQLSGDSPAGPEVLQGVADVIADRKANPKDGSYTTYLFEKGIEKIAKKVGEEATEVVIAAMQDNREELVYESADLLYHLLVMLEAKRVSLHEVWAELRGRQ